jgi:hypothetical protein
VQGVAAAGGPQPGQAEAFAQGCPKGSLGPGPFVAGSYSGLARGSFRLGFQGPRTIVSGATDSALLAKTIDPTQTTDRCTRIPAETAAGRAVLKRTSRGFTQLGLPTVRATVEATGRFGQIDARLWDMSGGKQRIVDFGVYRLTPDQQGKIVFQLFGNGYRFARGHTVKLELVGNSDPLFRASNGQFHVAISNVHATIPTRQRPSAALAVTKPTKLR